MTFASKTGAASVFIWIGFICAISFMEAWLKFQAPDVTLPIGLGIGQLVFSALNLVEWTLSIIVAFSLVSARSFRNYIFYGMLFLLTIQTLWLLPQLDNRAELIINGENLPSSNLHFYYIGTEIIKLILLVYLGIKFLNNKI